MTRDYFILRNILEQATLTALSAEINFPVENVLDTLYYRRWRVAAAVAEVDMVYTSNQTIRQLVIRFPTVRDPGDTPHKFGVNDEMRLRLWNTTPSGTLLFDQTRDLEVDALGYSHWDIGSDIAHQYARLTINAPDLIAADGLLEIENIFAGVISRPSFNYNVGAQDLTNDLTEMDIGSFTGSSIGEPRARYGELQKRWDLKNDQEGQFWKSFLRSHGSSRSFVVVTRPERPLLKQCLIARFTSQGVPQFTESDGGNLQVSVSIIEHR